MLVYFTFIVYNKRKNGGILVVIVGINLVKKNYLK